MRLSDVGSLNTLEKSLQEERDERKMWQSAAKEAQQVRLPGLLLVTEVCRLLRHCKQNKRCGGSWRLMKGKSERRMNSK